MEGPLLRPLPCWRQRSGGLTMDQSTQHEPVMVAEVVALLRPIGSGPVVDATFGGGGHTRALVASIPDVQILALDRDPESRFRTAGLPARVHFVQANFAALVSVCAQEGIDELGGALFDLGVSSFQLEQPERGFSFREKGRLDMRMGPDAARTASDVVNTLARDDLAEIIRRFGEEPNAGRIAGAIVAARPIEDTARLAEVVASAVPTSARRRRHPARRTFQAIRIFVNDELEALQRGLDGAIDLLRPGGRIVVISYHSLEDRIAKRRLAAGSKDCSCPPDLPECRCEQVAELRLLTRKGLQPSAEEVAANPRARSARLRAAEKLGTLPSGSGDAA